jgi:hypothetical protein
MQINDKWVLSSLISMEILFLINNTKEVGKTGPRLLIPSNFALG